MTGHLSNQLENIANRMEQFIDWSGRVVSWCVLLMVLLTFLVVVLRYVFDSGWIALQESVSYLHSLVFLLGAAYTLKHDAHVRVDIFYSRFSERSKAWVELLGHLFILIPVMLFIAWISWPYISDAWSVKESSRDAGGLPGVYLLKSLILLMSGLLIIQALVLVMRAALKLGGRNQG
jgi:TRAP-type mannitol/chloroaromatic compound transport system permease small subunit